MNSDRIKKLQEQTAFPDSVSVRQALLQVWNECQQENNIELAALRKENEELRECLKGALQIMQQTKKHRENVGWIGGDIFLNATISEAENLLKP